MKSSSSRSHRELHYFFVLSFWRTKSWLRTCVHILSPWRTCLAASKRTPLSNLSKSVTYLLHLFLIWWSVILFTSALSGKTRLTMSKHSFRNLSTDCTFGLKQFKIVLRYNNRSQRIKKQTYRNNQLFDVGWTKNNGNVWKQMPYLCPHTLPLFHLLYGVEKNRLIKLVEIVHLLVTFFSDLRTAHFSYFCKVRANTFDGIKTFSGQIHGELFSSGGQLQNVAIISTRLIIKTTNYINKY